MPSHKTYESAYIPNEEPPPPRGPAQVTGTPVAPPPAKQALLIAGSRYWTPKDDPAMRDYVGRVVQRAKDKDMRLLVGDNPNGVDKAVVDAASQLGVDTLVYGVERQPRYAGVTASQHVRYVQVQKETVEEIAPGGAYSEPRHRRSMRLLTYQERDERLVDNADRVLCIWNGQSPGTKNVYDVATARGKTADLAQLQNGQIQLGSLETAPGVDVDRVNQALEKDPEHAQFLEQVDSATPAQQPDAQLLAAADISGVDVQSVARQLKLQAFPTDVLANSGLEAVGEVTPDLSTQPYYDRTTDTALWVGLLAGKSQPTACVLAVQAAHSPMPEASLTPCYRGDAPGAWRAAGHLAAALDDAPDLSRFLGVVEGLARANDLHADWATPQGHPLPDSLADNLGQHVQSLDLD